MLFAYMNLQNEFTAWVKPFYACIKQNSEQTFSNKVV